MDEWCKRQGVYAFIGAPFERQHSDGLYICVYSIGEVSLADEVAKSEGRD